MKARFPARVIFLKFIPYIKYVIAKDTRFERDRKLFFDSDGPVAQGTPLANYGWGPGGFRELVEALYMAKFGTQKGFEDYYIVRIREHKGDIVSVLRSDGLIGEEFPAFIRMTLKEGVEVPVLLVNVDRIYYKYCDECKQAFVKSGVPPILKEFLAQLGVLDVVSRTFQCPRQICEALCDNYKYCVLNYTSTEGEPQVEEKKEKCLIELFKQLKGVSPTLRCECLPKYQLTIVNLSKHAGEPRHKSRCIERYLRFDFRPLRYYFFDSKTWAKMEEQRYSKGPYHNFDMLPVDILPNFIQRERLESTELVAPLSREGALECFLKIADVKFELRHTLIKKCAVCRLTHRLTDIPIKAMFRDQDVFRHEASFGELLWEKLWNIYPTDFCRSFHGREVVPAKESEVLKRNLKVHEISTTSQLGLCEYDYAINLSGLGCGVNGLLLFDLTTGLWKKSGFHEESKTAEEHVRIWGETLFRIPMATKNTVATWYIVVNNTEDNFFDETAPANVGNVNQLVDLLTSNRKKEVKIVRVPEDIDAIDTNLHKLVVMPIFNTLQRKGEARVELRRLEKKLFNQLLISRVVDSLMSQ